MLFLALKKVKMIKIHSSPNLHHPIKKSLIKISHPPPLNPIWMVVVQKNVSLSLLDRLEK